MVAFCYNKPLVNNKGSLNMNDEYNFELPPVEKKVTSGSDLMESGPLLADAMPNAVSPENSSNQMQQLTPSTSSAPILTAASPTATTQSGLSMVSQQQTVQQPSVSAAADIDLIEKEWIDKAKHIVAKTYNDPYQQNKAFSHLKSEYMSKRYGKIVKAEE